MHGIQRREFLRSAVATLIGGWTAGSRRYLWAAPFGLPVGLQLWTVRTETAKDVPGTLKKVAELGYQEVEISQLYGLKPPEFRALLEDCGLKPPSAHYSAAQIQSGWEKQIAVAKELGLQYMVISSIPPEGRNSLDDFRRFAEVFNRAGEQCQNAGIQLAYHNHNFEFQQFDGVVAYDELLRRSDPQLVQMQLDCYWITRAGKDPVEYFEQHPGRFPLLHIKDLKPGYPPSTRPVGDPGPFTEVGRGVINWKRIFQAARRGGLQHYYVEQDFCERPALESVRISYQYLKNLKV